MAFPYTTGLTPSEVAFLCEMELVTVVPRQRLQRLDLLSGPTNALLPPQRTAIPLWLALLLKRQKRANIMPPPWLSPDSLQAILDLETQHYQDSFSPAPAPPPTSSSSASSLRNSRRQLDYDGRAFYASTPFLASQVAGSQPDALPYHWFEMGEMLLDAAADDLHEPDIVRGLLKDIREIRLAKMRKGVEVLGGEGDGVRLDGVGAMEISESRGLITGVMDGLRKIGASREQTRREREQEERDNRRYADDEDEDMT